MTEALAHLWTPLATTPLVWLFVTLTAYAVGLQVHQACGRSPLASPVLIAIAMVSTVVVSTGTSYSTYFAGAQFIHFLLGPATIALAVPLARNLGYVRGHLRHIAQALAAGSLTAVLTGVTIVWGLGGSRTLALSMAPKAVTTPIAMAVSGQIGGLPSLTATLAILGGIVAAIVGQGLLMLMRIEDWRAHGLAAGVAGSGVAAAQVAARDPLGAAFATLGVGLNGLLTAVIVPLLALLFR
ncbi:MAG: LrgB family protein [Burkholderiaceae bacterium]|nr:LrgB family protein [Burkholderiaceae bacterium]